jgi:allantoinase
MQRDFVGYGPNRPKIEWPGGARIAISVVVNYEEGSEASILDGYPRQEAANGGVSPLPEGMRDLAQETMVEYGSRAGVWRLMDIFDEFRVNATIYGCAVALERNPIVGQEVIKRGHEVMGHGYRWESYYDMSREQEKEAIRKCVESIERTCGQRPLGWYVRSSASLNTRELLMEEGGFLYDCNAYNDDLPYYTQVKGKPWLVMPYSLEVNDGGFWRGGGMSKASDLYENMVNAFDTLYSEGATHPKMMSIGLHCRTMGTPAKSIALRRFLDYALSRPGVWFARRRDIATWWMENYPDGPPQD